MTGQSIGHVLEPTGKQNNPNKIVSANVSNLIKEHISAPGPLFY